MSTTVPLTTTLAAIRAFGPCADGWKTLVTALNAKHASGTWPESHRFPLAWILDSNGYEDTKWALRVLGNDSPILRLWLADCAEHVLHLFEQWAPNDRRPRAAIEATRQMAAIQLGAPGDLAAAEAARAAWAARAAEAAWAARAAEAAEAAEAAWAARAAEAAERDWQQGRLRFYLDGGVPAPIQVVLASRRTVHV